MLTLGVQVSYLYCDHFTSMKCDVDMDCDQIDKDDRYGWDATSLLVTLGVQVPFSIAIIITCINTDVDAVFKMDTFWIKLCNVSEVCVWLSSFVGEIIRF